MPTYSFGKDSPLKFELDPEFVQIYNTTTEFLLEETTRVPDLKLEEVLSTRDLMLLQMVYEKCAAAVLSDYKDVHPDVLFQSNFLVEN